MLPIDFQNGMITYAAGVNEKKKETHNMQLTEPHSGAPGVIIINGGTQGLGEAPARKLSVDGASGLVLSEVAIGMPVTRHPSHRSRRALLTHRAPALSIGVKANCRIRMDDTHCRKVAAHDAVETSHSHTMTLAAPARRNGTSTSQHDERRTARCRSCKAHQNNSGGRTTHVATTGPFRRLGGAGAAAVRV